MCKKDKMQINEIEDHMTQECEFRTIECKECNESILHSTMNDHIDIHTSYCKDCGEKIRFDKVHECKYESIKCNVCHKSMQRIFMEMHLGKECPRRIIQCDVCGVEKTADFMESYHKNCALVSCMHCDNIYTTETIVLHVIICQEQKLTCSFSECDFICKLKHYEKHLMENHTIIVCNISRCEKPLLIKDYIKHVQTQHNGRVKAVITINKEVW
uniref:TRAF-type zinc finger protein n=1 Tax=Pithovirus LCPAC401 TaxID=2506595 RepID=A0A481Z9X1_9VIRU|nr:MAG: hypothetical protein LCPAC401_02550 [Pithovirus LCPAC401]